jgi:uncharacterized membrane protein
VILPLATIGLLERNELRQHAQAWIKRFRKATAGQLPIVYLAMRELTAAVGLTGLGGHVQMVRPLIAPMVEGAAEARHGPLPMRVRHRLRALAAATDNVGGIGMPVLVGVFHANPAAVAAIGMFSG